MRSTGTIGRFAALALCLLFSLAGARGVGAQGRGDADMAEINAYRLTEAKLAKFVEATRNLAEAVNQNPSMAKDEDRSNKEMSLAQMAAFYDKHPPIKRAINSAGMSSREYVTFMLSMFQAGMMSWAAKQPGAKLPPEVSRENIAFMDSHKEQLAALQKEFQALERSGKSADARDDADDSEEEDEEQERDSTPAHR